MLRHLYINSIERMPIAKVTKPGTPGPDSLMGFGHICKLLYLSEPNLFSFDYCQEEH